MNYPSFDNMCVKMKKHSRYNDGFIITIIIFALFLPSCLGLPLRKSSNGRQRSHSSNGHQRSYIDIDASDPFKVPKSSEYVDQPTPEYDDSGNRRHDNHDEGGLYHYKTGAVSIQPESRYHSDGGDDTNRHSEDQGNSQYNENGAPEYPNSHFDGPQVPATPEESPQDTEPDGDNSNANANEDIEHTVGESRHFVPKADWKPDEGGSYHEEEGSHYEPPGEQHRGGGGRGEEEDKFYRKNEDHREEDNDRGRERERETDGERKEDRYREGGRDGEREREGASNFERRGNSGYRDGQDGDRNRDRDREEFHHEEDREKTRDEHSGHDFY